MSNDLAVELLAVLATLGPPGLQVRFIGFEHPGAFGHGFSGGAFFREGVLAGGPVGDAKIIGYALQILALVVPLADLVITCLPLGLSTSALLLQRPAPAVDALGRQYGGSGFVHRLWFRQDHLFDVAAMAVEDTLSGLAPVRKQVPTICYMYRLWSALAPADGVPLAAIARDDLNSRIFFEPAGERLCLSVRQKLDEAVLFEVHERGTVVFALALRPVVHAEEASRRWIQQRRAPDQRDERRRAGRKPDALCQPGSGLSSEGESYRLQ